jgi:hypothetical protein
MVGQAKAGGQAWCHGHHGQGQGQGRPGPGPGQAGPGGGLAEGKAMAHGG